MDNNIDLGIIYNAVKRDIYVIHNLFRSLVEE